jgi:hypothetical protein
MLVSLLALSVGTITFENPGIRLELFLKEISKQTGVGFHCPVYLNNEVLAASFKDQSIDVLKSQLARVIHGTWEQKEDGWWLTQSSEQKKQEGQWHRDLRRKVIQDIIDVAKATAPTKEWTISDAEQYRRQDMAMRQPDGEHVYTSAERRQFYAKAPPGRFAASLFAQLKPEMFPLDSMEPEYQLYAIRGNGIGKELGIDISHQLEMLNREYNLLSTELSDKGEHVIVAVSNSMPLRTSVTVYDKKWQLTAYGSPSMSAPNYRADGELFTPSKNLTESLEALSYQSPVVDPDTLQTLEDPPRMRNIWKRHNDTFADAVNRDPLGLLQGQSWIDYANESKKPMLANLCDSPTGREPKLFVPVPVQTHTTFYTKRDDADGWVLGRPIDPLWNRSHRLDRNLLVQYVKFLSKQDEATIEEQAMAIDIDKYANTFCSGVPNLRLLHRDIPYRDLSICSGLYGAAIRAGIMPDARTGILDIQKLPAYAQGYLRLDYNFGSLVHLVTDDSNNAICEQYLMPNGLQGVYLKVEPSIEPIFELKNEDGEPRAFSLSLEYFAETIKEIIGDQSALDKLKFRLGTRRKAQISLCLGERSIDEVLTDPPKNLVDYTWKSLPQAIKKMVMDKINEDPPVPPTG